MPALSIRLLVLCNLLEIFLDLCISYSLVSLSNYIYILDNGVIKNTLVRRDNLSG